MIMKNTRVPATVKEKVLRSRLSSLAAVCLLPGMVLLLLLLWYYTYIHTDTLRVVQNSIVIAQYNAIQYKNTIKFKSYALLKVVTFVT